MQQCTNEKEYLIKIRKAKDWVKGTTGQFSGYIFGQETGFFDAEVRNDLLFEFVESGLIEAVGDRHGFYRKVDRSLERIDWRAVRDGKNYEQGYPLILPLGLNLLCGISTQNVIVFAGETNSGKSELALKIAHDNLVCHGGMHKEIDYYSNEFSPEELCGRVMNINNKTNWDGVEFYQRYDDFHSVIKKDSLTIIDYLDVYDDFWLIGRYLDKIHRAIGSGVAIVCIQKHQNSEYGMGGQFTAHRARLMVSIAYNKETHLRTARIIKCKKPISNTHPDGMQMDYAVERDGTVRVVHDWQHVTKEQREARDKTAAAEIRQREIASKNAKAREALGL